MSAWFAPGRVAAGRAPDYRARLADERGRLAHLTPKEDGRAADLARLAEQTEGWR